MQTINTEPNQTIYDVAAQHYGNAGAVGEIADNNPHLVNDPAALEASGLDPHSEQGFYFDLAIIAGTPVAIDPDSTMMRRSIAKDIRHHVTTFEL